MSYVLVCAGLVDNNPSYLGDTCTCQSLPGKFLLFELELSDKSMSHPQVCGNLTPMALRKNLADMYQELGSTLLLNSISGGEFRPIEFLNII